MNYDEQFDESGLGLQLFKMASWNVVMKKKNCGLS